MDLFSVYQYFVDGSYEKVVEFVPATQATDVFMGLTTSLGGQMGTTQRVIIVDTLDCINAEWIFGKGLVYPTKKEIEGN